MPGLSLGLGLGLSRSQGGGINLAAFMASQADGFWYDFASPDRLFQEGSGPTPADEPNEVIGLALSQRLWNGQSLAAYLAVQPELVTDPSFNNSGAWTPQTGWSVTGGQAVASSVAAFGLLNQSLTVPAGRLCRMEIVVSSVSAGGIRLRLMGGAEPTAATRTAPGTYVEYLIAGGSTTVTLQAGGSGFTGTVDSISVKEVSRYPATQTTTNFKPKFQLVGATGDGADDRLGTTYSSTTGDAFALYPATTVPATLSATQVIAGAMDGSANGDYLAITTGGALRAKVGATTLDSTGVDLRAGVHDVGYWTDGSTLYLYADGAIVASGAWTGTRPTTVWNLFALNNNGTASSFFAGSIRAALVGRQDLTLSLANQLSAPY